MFVCAMLLLVAIFAEWLPLVGGTNLAHALNYLTSIRVKTHTATIETIKRIAEGSSGDNKNYYIAKATGKRF